MRAISGSFRACAGEIVLGTLDGIASIVGLIFGVAATGDRHAVLIAGCTGAVSAAVSMMGGVFMEAQTQGDTGIVSASPMTRAAWMLVADFLAASVPILPFVFLPVSEARWLAGALTVALLTGLGLWRAALGNRSRLDTVLATNAIGLICALSGVLVGAALA